MHNVISSCVFPSGALGAQGERWWGGVGGCGDCRRGGRGEGKGDIFSPSFSFSPSPSVNFLFIYFFFLLYFADCVGTFGKARSKIFGVYVSDTFIVCVCVCVHLCMCLCVYIYCMRVCIGGTLMARWGCFISLLHYRGVRSFCYVNDYKGFKVAVLHRVTPR